MLYAPLRFMSVDEIDHEELSNHAMEIFNTELAPLGLKANHPDDIAKILWDRAYLDESKWKQVMKTLVSGGFSNVLDKYVGVPQNKINYVAEISDFFLIPTYTELWAKDKQVYKMDNTFAKFLVKTDKFSLHKKSVEDLQHKHFYLDLESCKDFGKACGVFVNVVSSEKSVVVVYFILDESSVVYSGNITGLYGEDDFVKFSVDELVPKEHDNPWGITPVEQYLNIKIDDNSKEISHRQIVPLILQLLTYMGVKDKDIKENATTKTTYKKRVDANGKPIVKNKFSEIQMYDVGFIKGKELHIYLDTEETKTRKGHTKQGGYTVRPHIRNAHWQHYWTGKGRVNYEVRWIEPSFVNGKGEEMKDLVVMHDIKVSGLKKDEEN